MMTIITCNYRRNRVSGRNGNEMVYPTGTWGLVDVDRPVPDRLICFTVELG